jgi:hypothetical protein
MADDKRCIKYMRYSRSTGYKTKGVANMEYR